MYKEWMLIFYWKTTETDEYFYFDTKEDMMKFIKVEEDNICVEAMFHLERIDGG